MFIRARVTHAPVCFRAIPFRKHNMLSPLGLRTRPSLQRAQRQQRGRWPPRMLRCLLPLMNITVQLFQVNRRDRDRAHVGAHHVSHVDKNNIEVFWATRTRPFRNVKGPVVVGEKGGRDQGKQASGVFWEADIHPPSLLQVQGFGFTIRLFSGIFSSKRDCFPPTVRDGSSEARHLERRRARPRA